ncbi:cupin domain-containing protein [Conexibacter stalactiti]|uniref:Cupin domain-containing protein n=1 Tax=Conexibacter stalactiti TaxID=1940611 RepID=A0ABU4HPV3_9ACTN|nr:cupin domain-containing protein [Conexibacter stalactiti]MDW5595330.1 cupin domain-containing protein [Conexibacter stalactiti]MEC5035972.1 cupin domain-containing protein [Conexibacter stalactiti]
MNDGFSFTRLDPRSGERFQALRRELGVSSFGMNLITLQPGQRGRIHSHARQEEVFFVLEGELALGIDGEEHTLGAGELARVAPDLRRQLTNRRPQRLVLLALGGDGEHTGRDGTAYATWDATEGTPPQETPLPDDVAVEQS